MFDSTRKYVSLLEQQLADEKARNKALTEDNKRLINLVVSGKMQLKAPFNIHEPVADMGPGFRRKTMQDQIRELEAQHDHTKEGN